MAAGRTRASRHLDPLIAIVGLTLTSINMFGGFAVTRRMLAMFQK